MSAKGAPAARAQRVSVIACPWHNNERPHPGGAPECAVPVGDLSVGRVVAMGDLLTWLTLVVSELGIQWAALLDAAGITMTPEEEAVTVLAEAAEEIDDGYAGAPPAEDGETSNPDIAAKVAEIEGGTA